MIAFIKGQCYDEFKRNGQEGPQFDLVDIGHGQIMLFKKHPSDMVVEAFSKISKIELGLLYYHKQILFLFKTDQTQPVDMPYTPQLSHIVSLDELKDYPDPDGGFNVNLLLIDSVTGEVKGIQVFGTDLKFHKELAKDIRDKMSIPYSPAEDQKALQSAYALYPNYEKLVKGVDVLFKWQG